MSFSREQLTYASGSLLDEFAAEKGLTRHPDESCAEFRGRVDRMAFPVAAKDESGPASPSESHQYGPALGMTMRDYFAAKSVAGMLSNEEAIQRFRSMSMSEGFESATLMATAAYQIADAMLWERSK